MKRDAEGNRTSMSISSSEDCRLWPDGAYVQVDANVPVIQRIHRSAERARMVFHSKERVQRVRQSALARWRCVKGLPADRADIRPPKPASSRLALGYVPAPLLSTVQLPTPIRVGGRHPSLRR